MQTELTKFYRPITESQKATTKEITESQRATAREITEGLRPIREGIEKLPQAMQPTGEETGEEEEDKSVGDIARKWLNRLNTDKTFGRNKRGKHHYIGDTHVIVKENNNIFIDDEEFEGTPGLWKLIMSKYPMDGDFTSKDYENYGRILVKTHSKSDKWLGILSEIWSHGKEFGGKGIVIMPSDPNALLERLDLLQRR